MELLNSVFKCRNPVFSRRLLSSKTRYHSNWSLLYGKVCHNTNYQKRLKRGFLMQYPLFAVKNKGLILSQWQWWWWHRYVGDIVMLVTSLCWWLYDDDWFEMLVAESLCWRLFPLCPWFSQCIKSVTNILNRSTTSQTCHQLIWSPTSVTNIDVTDNGESRILHVTRSIPIARNRNNIMRRNSL